MFEFEKSNKDEKCIQFNYSYLKMKKNTLWEIVLETL